jgi:hypothetical protein
VKHAFYVAYVRTSNANNINYNARAILVHKYKNNKDLQNLPIIYSFIDNVQEAVYYAQNAADAKFIPPRRFACDSITVESLLSKLHRLQAVPP